VVGTERYYVDHADLAQELVFATDHFGIAALLEVAAEKIVVFEGDDNAAAHYLREQAAWYRDAGTKMIRAFLKQRILDQKVFLQLPKTVENKGVSAPEEERFCQRCNGTLHPSGLNDDCKVVWTCSECSMEWTLQ
jgi:hypothetical protein